VARYHIEIHWKVRFLRLDGKLALSMAEERERVR
jgi:hypothetical protein